MTSLNIVDLIEKNPITKLSGTYNSKLLTRIKEEFTETQQQLFVSSIYCYLNYHQTNDFIIDLDNIWKWLGFARKINAKTVLLKNFVIEKDYKILIPQPRVLNTTYGGNNHQTIMLNIKTFKLFCIKSGTEKANEIHEYFIKLEEILQDTLQEESNELKLQLEQKGNEILQIKNINKELFKEMGIEKHKRFIQDFNELNVIYLFLLLTIENKMIIKIGSTQSIKKRTANLSNDFSKEILLIDVVQSDNYTKFENFLHHHEFIRKFHHPIEMKDKKMTTETYLVDKEQLDEIIKIIQSNKTNFEKTNMQIEEIKLKTEEERGKNEILAFENLKLRNENLKMKLEICNKNVVSQKVEEESDDETEIYDDDEETVSETDINIATCNYNIKKRNTNNRAPKVYKYNVNDLKTPIHIYDSPIEVERAFPSIITPSALKLASAKNTIYKDFRWFFVYINEVAPDTIPETVISRHKSTEVKLLAMIDINKTKIMDVFSTQKQACDSRKMKKNSFSRAINQESISSGHYWKYFDDCSIEMRNEFLSHSKLPEKHIPSSGKAVEQIDPRTKKIIAKHNSIRDVTKNFQMSVSSLKKASESGDIHNNYIWKIV